MKKLYIFLLVLTTCIFASCDNVFNRKVHIVYDGYKNPITIYADSFNTIKAQLPSRTEVQLQADNIGDNEYTLVTDTQTGISGYVKTTNLRERFIQVKKENRGYSDERDIRIMSLAEKLSKAGSPVSAKVFDLVEELHLNKDKFNTLTWLLAMVFGTICAIILLSVGSRNGSYIVMLIGVAVFAIAYFGAFVSFCIKEPFSDDLSGDITNLGRIVDILLGLSIFASGFAMLCTFQITISAIVPYTIGDSMTISVPGGNTCIQNFLLIAYGISLLCFQRAADWILWTMIGIQAAFSLYIMVNGFMRGIFIPPIIYVILFPFFYLTLAITTITLGIMLMGLVICILVLLAPIMGANSNTEEIIGIRIKDGMGVTLFEDIWK